MRYEMKNRTTEPPKSAMEYYIKLYCKIKKSQSSQDPGDIQEALKSWLSLSAAEQQLFMEKFKKFQLNYEKRYALYLKSVEPFMKKKPSRDEQIDDTHAPETNLENHKEDYIQESRSIPNETDDIICNNIQHRNEDNIQGSTILNDTDDIICNESSFHEHTCGTSVTVATEQEITNQVKQQITEPSPPSMTSGKELYDAVNIIGENKVQWKDLSKKEKGKYNSAVLSIKKDYIRKYKTYLENLPSKELFQHYIRCQEN